jgi:hypothetical protein
MSRPSSLIDPPVVGLRPEIARNKEDLPAPLAPRIPVICPFVATPENSLTAWMAPKLIDRFEIVRLQMV